MRSSPGGDHRTPPEANSSELSTRTTYRNNYGWRVVDPWVSGPYKSRREVRSFITCDRTGAALRDVIRRCVSEGSVIYTDQWKGCSKLHEDGYQHETGNHWSWYLYHQSGIHLQGIVRSWVETKFIMKYHRRPTVLLQSHLDEVARRIRERDEPKSLIECFWRDLRRIHNLSDLGLDASSTRTS